MVNILILGKRKDDCMVNYLSRAVSTQRSCLVISKRRIEHLGPLSGEPCGLQPPEVIVADCDFMPHRFKPDIIILKDSCSSYTMPDRHDLHVILNPVRPLHLQCVQGKRCHAVTCGYSPKDTVGFASIQPHDTVLALQRPIVPIHEQEPIEPFELPIQPLHDHWARYPLQSVFAALTLMGIPQATQSVFLK